MDEAVLAEQELTVHVSSSAPTPTPTATPTQAPIELPAGGGTPSDGGSLPWLALATGVIAIASGGLALAYRTRRIR